MASPIQRAFAEYFSAWGLFLPDEAQTTQTAGYLLGKGWSVRWRWHPDGSVEFLASHRMTNERWHRIGTDGTIAAIDVPFEAMVFPADASDAQREEIEREYRAGWSAHIEAVATTGMDPIQGRGQVPGELASGPDEMLWRLDDGEWQAAPLLTVA